MRIKSKYYDILNVVINVEKFKLISEYSPKGDQPLAIKELIENLYNGEKEQVLLGATGTGKTYTLVQWIIYQVEQKKRLRSV